MTSVLVRRGKLGPRDTNTEGACNPRAETEIGVIHLPAKDSKVHLGPPGAGGGKEGLP